MSISLDPASLALANFQQPGYQQKTEALLAGLVENGILLVDSREDLRDGIIAAADQLNLSPVGRNSRIWIEELLKLGRRRIVKAKEGDAPPRGLNSTECACHVGTHCAVDAIVSCQDLFENVNIHALAANGVLSLNDYANLHPFELERKKLASESFQLNTIAGADLSKLFAKTIRFTKWIRFYDPQIGPAGSNLRSFLEGIRQILQIYLERGYFANEPGGFVEIYTKQHTLVETAFGRISTDFIAPLRGQFPWNIRLFVKDDPHGIFHARFLESQNVIVNFDRGFDLFRADGTPKVNLVRMDEMRLDLIGQFRRLRTIYEDVI